MIQLCPRPLVRKSRPLVCGFRPLAFHLYHGVRLGQFCPAHSVSFGAAAFAMSERFLPVLAHPWHSGGRFDALPAGIAVTGGLWFIAVVTSAPMSYPASMVTP